MALQCIMLVLYMHCLQVSRYAQGVARFDFDQGLAPYNLHAYQQWQALAGHISAATVNR